LDEKVEEPIFEVDGNLLYGTKIGKTILINE
jgi:hypothetical protein